MMSIHRATRDQVLASRTGSLSSYTVTGDGGAYFEVLGPVPGDVDSIYAQARVTKLLVMVTRTGRANVRSRGNQVRVRLAFATDTGDPRARWPSRRSRATAGAWLRACCSGAEHGGTPGHTGGRGSAPIVSARGQLGNPDLHP